MQSYTFLSLTVITAFLAFIGLIVWHTALPPIAFIQLLSCFGQLIAVISPEIIRAVFAVPTHLGVGCFVVMTDNKLITPDSMALYDFITAVYPFFLHFAPHSLAYLRYAFSPAARSRLTRAFPISSGYCACSLRRVLPTLSKLGNPRYLY